MKACLKYWSETHIETHSSEMQECKNETIQLGEGVPDDDVCVRESD